MDPDLVQRLLSILNPVSSAQAQMLGPTIAPPHPGAGMLPPQSLELPAPVSGAGGRAQEFVVPGPRLDLAAQAQPQTLAGATVPPPPAPGAPAEVPGVPTPTNPMTRAPEPYMTEPYQAPTVGSVLEPVPLPTPRPANAPTAPTDASGAKKSGTDALLQSLRGVQMPKPPEAQKVSTPHAPALRPIQSGGLAELMASLGVGPQQAFPGLKLPSTLGAALGGR